MIYVTANGPKYNGPKAQLDLHHKAGDAVCAFMVKFDEHGALKETMRPTPGILAVHAQENMNANVLESYPESASNTRFFVPIKKDPEHDRFVTPPDKFLNTPDPSALDWYDIRPTVTAMYADSMLEAVETYNNLLKAGIEAAVKSVREMQAALELTPDECKIRGTAAEETPEPVWMSVPDPNPDVLIKAMNPALVLQPGFSPDKMSWEAFLRDVNRGCLTDYDGRGDIEIDGMVVQEGIPWITTGYVRVSDDLMLPFDRFAELLKGHEINVHWWNK